MEIQKIKKNDFVEIEFTGRVVDTGEIFDTNLPSEAEKINSKSKVKPLIICVGHDMLVKGFDNALVGKEVGKEYNLVLKPADAFGERKKDLVKLIPLSVFREKNIAPASGMILNLDGMMARVLTSSGGRIIVDFNNPLSGKEVKYEFTVKRKITDEEEKINALQDFFFKQRFEFKISENKVIFKDEKLKPVIEMFKGHFNQITGKEFVVGENKKDNEEEIKEEKNSTPN